MSDATLVLVAAVMFFALGRVVRLLRTLASLAGSVATLLWLAYRLGWLS